MYKIKKHIEFSNQRIASEEIGIAQETLNRIINGKQSCSKMTAYCITKTFKKDLEIEDLFIRIE